MNEPIPYNMDELQSLINSLANVNVVLRLELKGCIAVYDDSYILKAYPIITYPKNKETLDEMVVRAYYDYYIRLCSTVKDKIFNTSSNPRGICE